jgi:hypothetical protein
MAGDDPAGAAIGRSYDRSAAELIQAMVTTRNGLCNIGTGVRMSAHNYSLAEAMSDVGGRAAPLPLPPSTGPASAGPPPSAVGSTGSAPPGWGWVAPFIGMIWPTGDSAKLRAAAAAWGAAGTKFGLAEILGTAGPMGVIRAQHIPDGTAIDAAFCAAYGSTTAIVGLCQTIAAQLDGYAAKIDRVHAAILDLLARICDPLTGIKEVWDFLTDEDEDEIKKIADDIRTVIDNFTAEVDALGQQIETVLAQATTVVTTMGDYAARQWGQFLHGTVVGQVVNQFGQRFKGIGEEGFGLVKGLWEISQVRLAVDPIGYFKSLGEVSKGIAPLVGAAGEHGPAIGQAWKQLGKDVTHWDDWKTNPGEALGKSEFDLATLFLPGGPVSKLGKMGTAARDGLRELRKPPTLEPLEPPPVGPSAVKTPPPEPTPVPRAQPREPKPQAKPAPAPAGTTSPHSPTESKPPVGLKLPSTPPQASPPAPARLPALPGGDPAEPAPGAAHLPHSAPAPPEAHAPTPHTMPDGGHTPEARPVDDGPSVGNGHHQPAESPDSMVGDPENTGGKRVTISGHAAYEPHDGHTRVPRGTTITTYADHGSCITDALGNLIETGGDTSGVYSKTFLPGELIPDYTIYPPDGLNIMGTPKTVLVPTRLSDLINENMGPVDLAVCPYDEDYPTGLVYDVKGIFDESANTFTPYGGRD